MKNKTDFYAYLVCVAFALIIIVYALSLENFSGKILPLVIAGIMLVIAADGAVRSSRRTPGGGKNVSKAVAQPAEANPEAAERWRDFLPLAKWLVAYLLGITLAGFLIASPLFLLAYMRVYRSGWRRSIVVTAVTFAVIYGIFVVGFKVDLYPGLLFKWFG